MNQHTKLVSRSFNKAADTYDQYAITQAASGRELIKQIILSRRNFTHVFDAGCGTGITTAELAKSIDYLSFTAVDTAASLLQHEKLFTYDVHCMGFDYNDIHNLNQNYDLIFSNMALHWSPSFTRTLEILTSSLACNGMIAFTIPLQGTFSELSETFSRRDFFTRAEVETRLQATGCRLLHSDEIMYRQSFSDTLSALRSIKYTGANYVDQRRCRTLRGKSFLHSLALTELSYVTGFFIGIRS